MFLALDLECYLTRWFIPCTTHTKKERKTPKQAKQKCLWGSQSAKCITVERHLSIGYEIASGDEDLTENTLLYQRWTGHATLAQWSVSRIDFSLRVLLTAVNAITLIDTLFLRISNTLRHTSCADLLSSPIPEYRSVWLSEVSKIKYLRIVCHQPLHLTHRSWSSHLMRQKKWSYFGAEHLHRHAKWCLIVVICTCFPPSWELDHTASVVAGIPRRMICVYTFRLVTALYHPPVSIFLSSKYTTKISSHLGIHWRHRGRHCFHRVWAAAPYKRLLYLGIETRSLRWWIPVLSILIPK